MEEEAVAVSYRWVGGWVGGWVYLLIDNGSPFLLRSGRGRGRGGGGGGRGRVAVLPTQDENRGRFQHLLNALAGLVHPSFLGDFFEGRDLGWVGGWVGRRTRWLESTAGHGWFE